jgi:hypothetical protein
MMRYIVLCRRHLIHTAFGCDPKHSRRNKRLVGNEAKETRDRLEGCVNAATLKYIARLRV